MSISLWLAYVAAVFVISGTPGPNMLLSMTHGIHYGLARTFITMLGLLSGLAIVLSISLGGLGAVLVTSVYAFEIIKYAGAAYLIYLGIRTWRAAKVELNTKHAADSADAWRRFRTGILVSLSNPKAILFGVAFFPQFLDRNHPVAPQTLLLLTTFVIIETGWMLVYAGGGAQLATWLRKGQRMRWFNRTAGGAFVGAGVLVGALRR